MQAKGRRCKPGGTDCGDSGERGEGECGRHCSAALCGHSHPFSAGGGAGLRVGVRGLRPFGVALVGRRGQEVCGAAALVGACFGYMVLLGFADGLRYAAAAILTFAVSFAFYDIKLLRRPWAMPLIAGLINGCTGFIYPSEGGWRTVDVIYFLTELALTVAARLVLPAAAGPHAGGPGVELLSQAEGPV